MNTAKKYIPLLILFFIVSCSANNGVDERSIYDKWTLDRVVYPDGETKDFKESPGNFVEINKDHIIEIISGHGKRKYPYTQKDKQLNLTSGGERVIWVISKQEPNELQIETPIGRYILRR